MVKHLREGVLASMAVAQDVDDVIRAAEERIEGTVLPESATDALEQATRLKGTQIARELTPWAAMRARFAVQAARPVEAQPKCFSKLDSPGQSRRFICGYPHLTPGLCERCEAILLKQQQGKPSLDTREGCTSPEPTDSAPFEATPDGGLGATLSTEALQSVSSPFTELKRFEQERAARRPSSSVGQSSGASSRPRGLRTQQPWQKSVSPAERLVRSRRGVRRPASSCARLYPSSGIAVTGAPMSEQQRSVSINRRVLQDLDRQPSLHRVESLHALHHFIASVLCTHITFCDVGSMHTHHISARSTATLRSRGFTRGRG